MTPLTPEDLERELVLYDKQKLITYCLKLFNTNQELVLQVESYQHRVKEMDTMIEGLVDKNRELKTITWFQLLKKRLGL